MVFTSGYNMNDDIRKDKKSGSLMHRLFGGSAWSLSSSASHSQPSLLNATPPNERRSLHCGTSSEVFSDTKPLSKDYVEKEAKYMGTITDICDDFDLNNRAQLLSLLDEKKKLGTLSFQLSWQDDVIISFSVYNLKISWRDGESLIHRIPLHQIAGVGCLCDENVFYFFVKFGSTINQSVCNLALFRCENKAVSEEMCHITQHIFQLAYTNSTMEFFDKSIQDGANTPNRFNSYSTDDSSDKRETITLQVQLHKSKLSDQSVSRDSFNNSIEEKSTGIASTFPSASRQRLLSRRSTNGEAGSYMSSSTRSSSSRFARRSGSSSGSMSTNNSTPLNLQLQEYIQVLRQRLSPDELRQFAEHLHYFRTGAVPINVFSQQLLDIYTDQRKSLLLGMQNFIPDVEDRAYFKNFLQQNGLDATSENNRKNSSENISLSTTTLTNVASTTTASDNDTKSLNSPVKSLLENITRLDLNSEEQMSSSESESRTFPHSTASTTDITLAKSDSRSRPNFLRIPKKYRKKGMNELSAEENSSASTLPNKSKKLISKERRKFFGFKNRKKITRSMDDISATSPVYL